MIQPSSGNNAEHPKTSLLQLTVDGAADGLRGAEDLLHDAGEVPRVGARPHDARRVDDVVHRDVAVVPDVLHLLAVTGRLLEGLQVHLIDAATFCLY